ncbi:hypothetical protein DMN91_010118 [Ooceraea biroi]|uniref:PITH domain-containing protein n=1 Tax=Ooceraea biroi TaxID=2015173 RepID=A0A026W4E6_OOCBI|nr:PITH domain-containing protein CG6153 [Ooceraea biroi]EZA50471.1 PITH domain-containing protein [Ooceraea biroi]RLU17879.1 hypothetical protein DMN91_010118 [Ooceraea biroi]
MNQQCSCGDAHDAMELGVKYSLHEKIDKDKVECLNENVEGTGVKVFKTWENRLNTEECVESDTDPELLFNIPFTANVKLKGLIVIADPEYFPTRVKLFKNRPNMIFDDVRLEADQEFQLIRDSQGIHEYPVRTVKFSSVEHLSLYFSSHSDTDFIKIYYIGLRGEWTASHKHGVTLCVYEARPLIYEYSKDQYAITRVIK